MARDLTLSNGDPVSEYLSPGSEAADFKHQLTSLLLIKQVARCTFSYVHCVGGKSRSSMALLESVVKARFRRASNELKAVKAWKVACRAQAERHAVADAARARRGDSGNGDSESEDDDDSDRDLPPKPATPVGNSAISACGPTLGGRRGLAAGYHPRSDEMTFLLDGAPISKYFTIAAGLEVGGYER